MKEGFSRRGENAGGANSPVGLPCCGAVSRLLLWGGLPAATRLELFRARALSSHVHATENLPSASRKSFYSNDLHRLRLGFLEIPDHAEHA